MEGSGMLRALIRRENRVGTLAALSPAGALLALIARVSVGLAVEGNPNTLLSRETWDHAMARWNLPVAAAIGAFAFPAVGAAALWWHEQRTSRFRTADDVTQALSLRVLGVIPEFETSTERSARRWRLVWRSLTLAVFAGSIGFIVWWLV